MAAELSECRPSAAELVGFVHECAAANAENWSSMCQDMRAGRRTEIEQLNGWVERRARELGCLGPKGAQANASLAEAVRARHPP